MEQKSSAFVSKCPKCGLEHRIEALSGVCLRCAEPYKIEGPRHWLLGLVREDLGEFTGWPLGVAVVGGYLLSFGIARLSPFSNYAQVAGGIAALASLIAFFALILGLERKAVRDGKIVWGKEQ